MSVKKIHFQIEKDDDDYPPVSVESLWGKSSANTNEFTIDNVPFFIREATIGDTISVTSIDGKKWFHHVVSRSRNSLVRVIFFDILIKEFIDHKLRELGCSTEFLPEHNIMAVNIPCGTSLDEVQKFLGSEAKRGKIDFEEPLLRQ